jgi:hypothetical protein
MSESDSARRTQTSSQTSGGPPAGVPDSGEQSDRTHRSQPGAPATSARRRSIVATLIGAVGATVISLLFISSFMGALHKPGPHGVPVGIVGTPAQATALHNALDQQASGGFTVKSFSTVQAAQDAILDRHDYAALVPGPVGQVLLTATAAGNAVASDTVKAFAGVARTAGVPLTVNNIRPLPPNDPEGISQVFFVVALLAPSLVFGNMLVTKFGTNLSPPGQLLAAGIYAVIVAAVATAIADPAIGALTGAPWGIFGIGTLLAFVAAVVPAAAVRWGRGLGYLVVFLLFVPVGIASSGTTLGPHLITPWYADLGKALPAGAALPAIQNTVYFHGNAITTPLLVLSAWALAGIIALLLIMVLRRPATTTTQPAKEPTPTAPNMPQPRQTTA